MWSVLRTSWAQVEPLLGLGWPILGLQGSRRSPSPRLSTIYFETENHPTIVLPDSLTSLSDPVKQQFAKQPRASPFFRFRTSRNASIPLSGASIAVSACLTSLKNGRDAASSKPFLPLSDLDRNASIPLSGAPSPGPLRAPPQSKTMLEPSTKQDHPKTVHTLNTMLVPSLPRLPAISFAAPFHHLIRDQKSSKSCPPSAGLEA